MGLTTTQAPFIEKAKNNGELFIDQPYELYSDDNQQTWKKLYNAMLPLWDRYANDKFFQGLKFLNLSDEAIPKLDDVNRFLLPLTGFQAKAVSGYVPAYLFFDSLKNRRFPTTITIRDGTKLDYLSEPDIFHDIAGHVPMHTDATFADVLVKFGSLARLAAERHETIKAGADKIAKIKSNIQALSRFFWFSVEFGLIRQRNQLRVYGSGILSSAGEIKYAIESKEVQRCPFQLEWVINQSFEIDHYQPLLFFVESFEHLYEQVDQLEKMLLAGKLDNVAPGEPAIDDANLEAFIRLR